VQADVSYRTREVNPFGSSRAREPFEVLDLRVPKEAADVSRRVTDAQLAVLRKFGVELPKETPRGDAGKMLDSLFGRRKKDLCTFKQARVLARAGLRTNLSFAEASAAITALANSRWVASPSVLEQWGPHK
jgi:hypothetical protein